ncbi:hypothetical protein D9619_010918 [Psilocybe cf. subviscida]|uniref:K Homology domain-containing protein n=1 Tax=Psilocybe cf. subviscida TaxID=2480587 RepID=A0A8H5B8P5_9AGAR|nr:hypothetical protein D9619_010918 [Psilocybe cf. subviscida]
MWQPSKGLARLPEEMRRLTIKDGRNRRRTACTSTSTAYHDYSFLAESFHSSADPPKPSKRKWDEPAPGTDATAPSKVAKADDGKSASEAAAAAAAIAAKIAAQFANGPLASGDKDAHDAEFTQDIDINDVRNRYLLTRGSTQDQIHDETGASVGTRGVWYPDRSKATEKDPPLYIHISARTKEILDKAVAKVHELIAMDMGSLVEKGDKTRERRKWPEEKLPVGLESIRNFNIRAKVVGPSGSFVKYIQAETSTRVQIKGLGSGFIDQETGAEEPIPLYIHITGPDEGQVARAKLLTEDLLLVVRQEHAKVQVLVQQQQMELHHAQAQYAAYGTMGSQGYAPPPPSAPAPPPPPGEGPPPPPAGTPAGDAAAAAQYAGPPAPSDTEAYAAYWAAYGYDVNSTEFKEWQASQQQQYAQYYASYAQQPPGDAQQPSDAPPPPPPSQSPLNGIVQGYLEVAMSFSFSQLSGLLLGVILLLVLYIRRNDRCLMSIPPEALQFSPKRCTPKDVRITAERLARLESLSKKDHASLPPKTGRRYIVVGGGGFLGSWIVAKLLERGEKPQRIRIVDITEPSNHVVKDALSEGLQFHKVDITDTVKLRAAFEAAWPDAGGDLTVFHTAANIRFWERHFTFFSRSTRVNVVGTQNVIDAAKAVGASVLVYTSSGSVGVHSTRFLLWPWEKEPKRFVQVIDDDDTRLPQRHEGFFSNYAASKIQAEARVRAADKTPASDADGGMLRTGCIRPGNGIFGPRGDMLCGAYLVRKTNPTWISNVVQSFVYVENCVAAHLCYEARLMALQAGDPAQPDIGGQAFCIADPGPTPTYGDVYVTLATLTKGECHFPEFSATAMLLFAHGVEAYYRARHALATRWNFADFLPEIKGDIINLQPSLFALTSVHLIFDDTRARLPPEKGGLGYTGTWTTLEGLHKTFEEYDSGIGRSDTRSDVAGVSLSFGFNLKKWRKAAAENKMGDAMPGVPPMEVLPAA